VTHHGLGHGDGLVGVSPRWAGHMRPNEAAAHRDDMAALAMAVRL
jgi:hypothetical protein